jgi:glutaminase
VGGGIVAVQPAQFGVGVYSPRLDSWGNSVRGAAVLRTLSSEFDLHVFDHPGEPRSPVVSWTVDDAVTSGVLRGELDLISAESLIELMFAGADAGTSRIELDVTGVTRARTVAAGLLRAVQGQLERAGVEVAIVGDLD